ncbi:MAG: regulatory protein GemA [Burkholderiaceae bacterium]
MTFKPSPNRSRLVKLIHVAKRDLALDDETYRALLQRVTRQTSTSQCSEGQLERVIAEFKRLGFKVQQKVPAGAPKRPQPLAHDPDSRKIRALWLFMHEIGVVRDPSEAALTAYVKRIAHVDSLHWLRNPDPVIEGLKFWAARELPAILQARLERLGAGNGYSQLIASVDRGRNPDTYGVLLDAWEALDQYEQGEVG